GAPTRRVLHDDVRLRAARRRPPPAALPGRRSGHRAPADRPREQPAAQEDLLRDLTARSRRPFLTEWTGGRSRDDPATMGRVHGRDPRGQRDLLPGALPGFPGDAPAPAVAVRPRAGDRFPLLRRRVRGHPAGRRPGATHERGGITGREGARPSPTAPKTKPP